MRCIKKGKEYAYSNRLLKILFLIFPFFFALPTVIPAIYLKEQLGAKTAELLIVIYLCLIVFLLLVYLLFVHKKIIVSIPEKSIYLKTIFGKQLKATFEEIKPLHRVNLVVQGQHYSTTTYYVITRKDDPYGKGIRVSNNLRLNSDKIEKIGVFIDEINQHLS